MKVRILSDITDTIRTYVAGMIADVPDAQAAAWLENGCAESTEERVMASAPETATLSGGDEQAAQARPRRRG